jgi:hypothetical protein
MYVTNEVSLLFGEGWEKVRKVAKVQEPAVGLVVAFRTSALGIKHLGRVGTGERPRLRLPPLTGAPAPAARAGAVKGIGGHILYLVTSRAS